MPVKLRKKWEKTRTVLIAVSIVVMTGAGWYFFFRTKEPTITSFSECVSAGYPIMESYPRQCAFGKVTFFEKITEKHAVTVKDGGVNTVILEDWGVEIPLTDADKITISTVPKSNINPDIGSFDAYAQPKFIDGTIQSKECYPMFSLYRSDTPFKQGTEQRLIGGFYYAVTGLPNPRCEKSTQDNILLERLEREFTVTNLQASN